MQIVSSERIQPAADIREVARETPLLPAESKAIKAALAKLQIIGEITGRYAGKTDSERAGTTSPLHAAIWQAGEKFTANPSEETAAAVAHASIVWHASDVVAAHFSHYAAQARTAISAGLQPTAAALLDRAAEAMHERLDAAMAILDGAPALAKEAAVFRAKVQAAAELVAAQREQLASDPLRWLLNEIGIEI